MSDGNGTTEQIQAPAETEEVSLATRRKTNLSPEEARVIWTILNSTWAPVSGYAQFNSAMQKLLILGGGHCCRDCTSLATVPHRLGGMVCRAHDPRNKEIP